MSFPLEKDMYTTALKCLPTLFNLTSPYAYGVEIPLSYKVADIGFTPQISRDLDSAPAQCLARLSLSEVWAVAQIIEGGGASLSEFLFALGRSTPDDHKNRLLSSLCRAGLLKQNDEGNLSPTDWLTRQLGPIIFVELKLSRWEQALEQARFYSEKADTACVVLDGDTIGSVNKALFVEEGIGLFIAWSEHIEMLVAPKPSERANTTHKHFHRLSAIQDISRRHPRKWVLASDVRRHVSAVI